MTFLWMIFYEAQHETFQIASYFWLNAPLAQVQGLVHFVESIQICLTMEVESLRVYLAIAEPCCGLLPVPWALETALKGPVVVAYAFYLVSSIFLCYSETHNH